MIALQYIEAMILFTKLTEATSSDQQLPGLVDIATQGAAKFAHLVPTTSASSKDSKYAQSLDVGHVPDFSAMASLRFQAQNILQEKGGKVYDAMLHHMQSKRILQEILRRILYDVCGNSRFFESFHTGAAPDGKAFTVDKVYATATCSNHCHTS